MVISDGLFLKYGTFMQQYTLTTKKNKTDLWSWYEIISIVLHKLLKSKMRKKI